MLAGLMIAGYINKVSERMFKKLFSKKLMLKTYKHRWRILKIFRNKKTLFFLIIINGLKAEEEKVNGGIKS